MQHPYFFLGGGAPLAACLLMVASAACSNGGTDAIDREIRAAEADAAPPEDESAVPDEEDDAPTIVELETEEDGGSVAESDAGTLNDAGAPSAVDASAELDAGASAMDASVQSDGAAPSEPEAGIEPGPSTPKNYLRPQDSPFSGVDFAYFYLEDFEDHLLNTPGLRSIAQPGSATAAGQLSSTFGASVIDSVDGDDGVFNDNRCTKLDGYCDAWWGPGRLTFSFDVEVLGALPTHVGGVWTDGLGEVSFEAFGPDGASIYKVGPLSEPGFPDNTTSSSTAEDRFFGAYSPAGISAITISNTQGGVEMDHVQYGRAR